MTPVFIDERKDLNYHGWLELRPFGRTKFTDGQLTAFEPYSERAGAEIVASGEHTSIAASGSDMRGTNSEKQCVSAWTEIVIRSARQRESSQIPFWEELVRAGRILDDAAEREWMDDAERRLRNVLSRLDPQPTLLGYVAERLVGGLELYTITSSQIQKLLIARLCAGEWRRWDEIVVAVPEFNHTHVIFDGLSRFEWFRRWDMQIQRHRIQAEYGVFG